MTLTLGTGPLAPSTTTTASWNASFEGAPAHRVVFQPDARRVRALIGDVVVLDTVRAHLLHETAILPVVYAPLEDHVSDGWSESPTSTYCPFKGQASYRSLEVGGRVVEDLLWHYPAPVDAAPWLAGFGALYADKVDAWFVEDDRVVGHLKDPYHRVDAHPSSRRAVVRLDGQVVADSTRPVLVFETGFPVRVYVPPADVVAGAVSPGSGKRTVCAYKGEASYWSVSGRVDAAWSYELPTAEATRVAAHLCFDDAVEGLTVELGG